jgi:hypothetical protein
MLPGVPGPLSGGVIALALQGGPEFDGGDEEAAGFADGLEVAIHLDRSCTAAAAEYAPRISVRSLRISRPSSLLASWLGWP